jgi:hypothetical protein
MHTRRFLALLLLGPVVVLLTLTSSLEVRTGFAQAVATVTGTPQGPRIVVPDRVFVRSGPGVYYEQVGVLIQGQEAPAVGRSPAGEWIQIVYPGVEGNLAWVYAQLVRIEPISVVLPVVEPPPTPGPRITATIDPTLAARFSSLAASVPTRLPTYTPAQPVVQPTFESTPEQPGGWFPPIVAIAGLLVVGVSGAVVSFLRRG